MPGEPWTPDELELLKQLCESEPNARSVAARFPQRSIPAVRSKMEYLGMRTRGLKSSTNISIDPTDRPDPTNAEIARLESRVRAMEDEADHLRKKLRTAQRDAALFESLADVAARHITPLPAVKPLRIKEQAGETLVDGVLLLSDEHADQVIRAPTVWGLEEFDFDIFRCRFHRYIATAAEYLTVHLPKHRFERLWVFSLGDKLHGDIHGAAAHNHFPSALKAAIALAEVEAQGIQELARHVPVHWVGVSGNHARRSVRKDFRGAHDNFDYLATAMVAMLLKNDIASGRVTVTAPDSWTAYVDVRGHLWALNHGDDVVGYAGIPFYGFSRRNNRVQALVARKKQRVRYFAYGHFHTALEMQEADAESLHAGNWSLTDDYAIGKLAVGSEPVQQLYAVDEKRGIVLKVPIYVRDDSAEDAYRAGEWQPAFGRASVMDTIQPSVEADLPIVRAAS
jgi:hypothetical protein